MKKTIKSIWILLGVGFLAGCSGVAAAEESGAMSYYQGAAQAREGKINIGHLTIFPAMAVQEEYDDNIYLQNGNNDTTLSKESDWITHLRPSLAVKYDMMERGTISLGYAGDFAYYNTSSSNDWTSHKIAFNGDYRAPVGLIVGIANAYDNTNDPYSSVNDYQLGQKTQHWSDDIQTRLGYEFVDKFRVLAYYNFSKLEYEQEQDYSQNYDSNEVGAGVEMRVMPMTWAFLRGYTGQRDYTSHPAGVPNYTDATDASFKWNRVNTGLRWDATAKISGELNLGYQWLTANNEFDPDGNPYENLNTWIAGTRLSYQATPKTRVGAELFRATRFSGGNISQFYDETGFGLNLNQGVMEKGMLRASAGYSLNDYNQPAADNRKDDNYKALVGFDYYITEWLMAGMEYRYWDRESNYSIDSFTDNRFLMTVGIAY